MRIYKSTPGRVVKVTHHVVNMRAPHVKTECLLTVASLEIDPLNRITHRSLSTTAANAGTKPPPTRKCGSVERSAG